MNIQLDFFEPNDEMSLLKREIKGTFDRVENVRRGIFSRHNSFTKEVLEIWTHQQKEIEELKLQIDRLRTMLLKEVK